MLGGALYPWPPPCLLCNCSNLGMGRSFQGGNCTPDQNWACFVYYLKMFNTYLKNYMSTLKLYEKFANDIKISVGQVVALLFKTIFWIFWSVTQELLGLLKLQCYFWVISNNFASRNNIIFQKRHPDFEMMHKTGPILVWGAVPS